MASSKGSILSLSSKGLRQVDIATRLGISQQRVSVVLLEKKLGYYPYPESRKRGSTSRSRREAQERYRKSDKGKATILRYQGSKKFREALRRYYLSKKGQEAHRRSRLRREGK